MRLSFRKDICTSSPFSSKPSELYDRKGQAASLLGEAKVGIVPELPLASHPDQGEQPSSSTQFLQNNPRPPSAPLTRGASGRSPEAPHQDALQKRRDPIPGMVTVGGASARRNAGQGTKGTGPIRRPVRPPSAPQTRGRPPGGTSGTRDFGGRPRLAVEQSEEVRGASRPLGASGEGNPQTIVGDETVTTQLIPELGRGVDRRGSHKFVWGAGAAQREMTPASAAVGTKPSSWTHYDARGMEQNLCMRCHEAEFLAQAPNMEGLYCRRCSLAQELATKKGPLHCIALHIRESCAPRVQSARLERSPPLAPDRPMGPHNDAPQQGQRKTGRPSWCRPPRLGPLSSRRPGPSQNTSRMPCKSRMPQGNRTGISGGAVGTPLPTEEFEDEERPSSAPNSATMHAAGTPSLGRSEARRPGDWFQDLEEERRKVLPRDYAWTTPAGVGHVEVYASHNSPPFASMGRA